MRVEQTSPRWKVIGGVFAAWTLFGFLLGQQVYALRAGDTLTWGQAITLEIAYCDAWALLTPVVLRLRSYFPVNGIRWKRTVPIHLLCSLVMAAAAKTLSLLLIAALRVSWLKFPSTDNLLRSILGTLDYGAVLYAIVLLIAQTFESLRQHHADQINAAHLRTQLAEAQLRALRMQMHPHFLFNALNSVSALIHENPNGADRLVAKLSDLLRIFLKSSEADEVRLEQEIHFLQQYLDIQKIRFEERLLIDIHLDPRTRNASVPSLILQPLVENAIRHGIAERENEGTIEIHSKLEEGRVILSVADNGDGRAPSGVAFASEGTGLRNTRRRLETIYGRDYQFRMERQLQGGVLAFISIPYRLPLGDRA